jgi:uncharacterized SAM-binding protein YcdF (DUF218 family)
MFSLLIRVLLGLGFLGLLYWLFFKFIPKPLFTFLGGLLVAALLVLSFYEPSQQVPEPLWQFFIFPLKPLNFALCLMLAALVNILRTSKDKPLKIILSLAFALLFLLSTPVVSQQLVQMYEHGSAVATQKNQQEQVSTIVVLGQATTEINIPAGRPIQLTDRGDRLLYAAQIYKQQKRNNPIMIVSAGVRDYLEGEEKNRLETQDIETLLVGLGIPEGAIVQDAKSSDIHTSAKKVKEYLVKNKREKQKFMLITSAINMGRSYMTFKQLDLEVLPMATDFYSLATDNKKLKRKFVMNDVLPSISALSVSTKVVEDFFGMLYYFLRGWLVPDWGFLFAALI